LEHLETEVEINISWETIIENIKLSAQKSLGYFELKKHTPWFEEGCQKLLDERTQAKVQCSEINGDILNNVGREVSRYFRNNKKEYLEKKKKSLQ
jgi:hypothetical protein